MPQEKMKARADTLVRGMSMFLPGERTDDGDDAQNDAGELGSAGLGIDLGELLGQLALSAHGEHDAARGAVEGVHRAHGSKRGDDEHGGTGAC